ncbi:hypothetical protein [Isoptericola variabilis]|uniref:SatD family (SatD) n=1 Tax=Isoptericola variabilis (strain 225) TaxID=743718 RepID=F6FV27_ISOV2|nr:hypothetical protein [Isoptericola variabilis]AEG44367.1 hypothetical protein Isova_1614 [Isoptericola variabilis 225]
MLVLTVDQRGSTRRGDLVPAVLELLDAATEGRAAPGLVLPFERTVGDEVQGVLAADDAGARLAVDLVLALLRDGGWSVGVGAGPVDEPLPEVSRAASGPAFVRARAAVERAKARGAAVPVAVVGPGDEPGATIAADAEALLRLLGAVAARRTGAGWEAIDTLAGHATASAPQRATARALGVSEQAVSQRLRTALWAEEEAVRPLAARLLAAAGTVERPRETYDDDTQEGGR